MLQQAARGSVQGVTTRIATREPRQGEATHNPQISEFVIRCPLTCSRPSAHAQPHAPCRFAHWRACLAKLWRLALWSYHWDETALNNKYAQQCYTHGNWLVHHYSIEALLVLMLQVLLL